MSFRTCYHSVGYIGIGLFVFALHCGPKNPDEMEIARVGKTVLSIKDLKDKIPPEYQNLMNRQLYTDYVKRWIETELFYQEAIRLKLDREKDVRNQLEKSRRDILVAKLLKNYSEIASDPKEEEMMAYYIENKNEFIRAETEIKIQHILLPTLKAARDLQRRLTPDNFQELGKTVSLDPMERVENLKYLVRGEMLPEIANIVYATRSDMITPPIETEYGCYIVKIVDKVIAGSIRSYDEIRDEIRNKLIALKLEQRKQALLEELSLQSLIQTNFELLIGKSTDSETVDKTDVKKISGPLTTEKDRETSRNFKKSSQEDSKAKSKKDITSKSRGPSPNFSTPVTSSKSETGKSTILSPTKSSTVPPQIESPGQLVQTSELEMDSLPPGAVVSDEIEEEGESPFPDTTEVIHEKNP